jgi:hypothetical protein
MRLVIAMLVELAIAHASFAADFRSADFGMSPAQVRATEPDTQWLEKDGIIGFKTKVGGLDALAQYEFTRGRFSRGGYQITARHSNSTDYLGDYASLQMLLREKYGPPKQDRTIWLKDLYKDDPQHWGTAVASGQLRKMSEWQTDRAKINLLISGDNFEVELFVLYASLALKGEADAEANKDKLNGL